MKISVIICTHNPKKNYLSRTLLALEKQTLPKDLWELLLIDNASKEEVAGIWDLAWHPHARHIRENEVGLTPARLRGIRESSAELLVFVDDDNLLDESYLENALNILMEHDELGAFGGSSVPEFESQPDPRLLPLVGGLALGIVEEPIINRSSTFTNATPFGAGICVRSNVTKHYLNEVQSNPNRVLLGRKGKSLGAGEDTDLALCACDLGMCVGRFPSLKLIHIIPTERVSVEYLEKIYEGFGRAKVHLELIRAADGAEYVPSRLRMLRTIARWYHSKITGNLARRVISKSLLAEFRERRRLAGR